MLNHPKSYFWEATTWFSFGVLFGTYFPETDTSHKIYESIVVSLLRYPLWLHIPLIVCLGLLFFRPSVDVLRRYRHNWDAKTRFFTVIDGIIIFAIGSLLAALLNGSFLYTISKLPQSILAALLLWLGSSIAFLLTAYIFSLRLPQTLASKKRTDELIDAPIVNDEDDLLGRISFVTDFYKQLRDFPSEDSFVFGLNGPWGSGKTSVLNLLKNRLRADKNVILVDFNPWYFQSPETISKRFYESIAQAINREFFYPQINSILRRYARILTPVLKRYGLDSIQPNDASVEEIKELAEQYILNTGKQLIVIIDDLERADGNELFTVCQMVRLSASFKKTLFILAYDQSQVIDQLDELGVSRDFLGKIIQNPVDLPSADKDEIDRFVLFSVDGHRSQIDKLLDKLKVSPERREVFDKQIVGFYLGTLSLFFFTLRNAKRFLTALSIRLAVVFDEVNLFDFFLLEVLRVFSPRVYQDIWDKPHYYIPSWTNKIALSSPFGIALDDSDKDLRRKQIKAHVDELLKDEPYKDNILNILKELFPAIIGDALGRKVSYGDNVAARFRAEKRLTHPESFEKYFLLSVPKGSVPDALVENTLASWSAAKNTEEQIAGDIEKLSNDKKLVEVLNRILIFLQKIDNSLVCPLLLALSRHVKSVPPNSDNSEQNTELKLILFLLSERTEDSEKQSATELVVNNIHSLDVAVRFVQWLSDSQVAVTWTLQRSLNLDHIRKLILGRFKKAYVGGNIDIFNASSNALFILYQVGSYDAESRQVVNTYVMDLLGKHPKYIGKLIDGFLIEFPGPGPNGFQWDNVIRVYDVQGLIELVEAAGDKAIETEKQKRAIEAFLQRAKSSQSQDDASTS